MTAKPKSKPRTRAPKKKAAAPPPTPVERAPEVEAADANEAPLPGEAFTPPEINFSARVPSIPPDRPWPTRRRAIFIDVENTSRPGRVTEALDAMRIDHATATTDIVASGNWRVIGNETARLLAGKGAQLVHSAPKTGVRDWSDLRIAVGAGVWLASARPGDRLDIVSDDKAFDAVGDVAATLGVEFHRHTFRKGASDAAEAAAPATERAPRTRGGRNRRGGRGRSTSTTRTTTTTTAPPREETPPPTPTESVPEDAIASKQEIVDGAAPVDDLLRVAKETIAAAPQGMVTLDALANRLKQLGFQRPPNSPRLVTRLRAFKDLQVSPRGHIKLSDGSTEPQSPEAQAEGGATPPNGQRRRRRGGRGRGRGGRTSGAAAPSEPTT